MKIVCRNHQNAGVDVIVGAYQDIYIYCHECGVVVANCESKLTMHKRNGIVVDDNYGRISQNSTSRMS